MLTSAILISVYVMDEKQMHSQAHRDRTAKEGQYIVFGTR